MGTKHPELFAGLCSPFDAHEVKTINKGGRSLSYVTARSVANRLDAVVGPENWRDTYTETKEGLKCRLEIRLPDGEWIWKEDGGGFAGMADGDDNEKTAFTSAFKRAAAKWGPGRYLYRDGVPDYSGEREHGEVSNAPPTSAPSRPPANGHAQPPTRRDESGPQSSSNIPHTGKALYAWCKEQEDTHGHANLVKYLNGWAKLQDLPGRMIDWDEEQVALGYAEAVRKLKSAEATSGQPAAPPKPTGDPVVDILRLRQDLINAVWKVARKAKGEHAGNDVYWSVMDSLNNAVGSSRGGEVLGDLEQCNDPDLIRAYIEAAGEAWKFASEGTAA